MDGLVEFLADCPMLKGILDTYAQSLLGTIARDYKLNIAELAEYYNVAIPEERKSLEEEADKNKEVAEMLELKENSLKHSHLPVRWLVVGCDYCAKHGNVLCNE